MYSFEEMTSKVKYKPDRKTRYMTPKHQRDESKTKRVRPISKWTSQAVGVQVALVDRASLA